MRSYNSPKYARDRYYFKETSVAEATVISWQSMSLFYDPTYEMKPPLLNHMNVCPLKVSMYKVLLDFKNLSLFQLQFDSLGFNKKIFNILLLFESQNSGYLWEWLIHAITIGKTYANEEHLTVKEGTQKSQEGRQPWALLS